MSKIEREGEGLGNDVGALITCGKIRYFEDLAKFIGMEKMAVYLQMEMPLLTTMLKRIEKLEVGHVLLLEKSMHVDIVKLLENDRNRIKRRRMRKKAIISL